MPHVTPQNTAQAAQAVRPAPVRAWRERAIQTVAFEAGGLLAVGPLWSLVSGATAAESVTLLVCLSVAVTVWMALYNTAFDLAESRLAGTVASDRGHRWRAVHAVGLEVSSTLVTWPIVMLVTGLGWLEALAADIGLGVAYAVYGYLFHLGFDRLRPVVRPPVDATGPDRRVSG